MPITYTVNPTKVIEGAAEVLVGAYGAAQGACTSIGSTDGGVMLTVGNEYHDVEVDQSKVPIDTKLDKRTAKLSCDMAEATLANLALAMALPTTALSGSTVSVGLQEPENKTIYIVGPAPDGAVRTIHVFKAKVTGSPEMAYRKDEKVIVPLEITAIPDFTQGAGKELMTITDAAEDTTPPTVSSSDPADADNAHPKADSIVWTMSESMDAGSINTDTVYVIKATDGTVVPGTVTYTEADKKITFDPTAALDGTTAYIAILTTNVRDLAYNQMAAANVINFTTAA